jgi:N-acetylmuramoyl-L-alanine amidase
MNIEKKLIKYNFSSRNGQKISYIVIHDTGNKNKGADAEAHYKYFSGGNRNASAHYFVDDKKVIQIIEDNNASWHCGDGRGKFGITNQNSIGIEICVNVDGNYEKAFKNAIELTKELMKKYNIPTERVVRHYDASRKLCPASMSIGNWAKWSEFKKLLVPPIIPNWGLLKRGSVGQQVKELQAQLNKFGYKLVVDGIFGSKTETAVKDFQAKKKLSVDGIVGNNTRKALFS